MSVNLIISNGKVSMEVQCDTDGDAGTKEIHEVLALAVPAWKEVMETLPTAEIVELDGIDYQVSEKESEDVEAGVGADG